MVTHSERTAPEFGSVISVESRSHAEEITEFRVRWQHTHPAAIQQATAHYVITSTKVWVEREIEGARDEAEYEVKTPFVVSPLMRIYMGKTIKEVERLGAGSGVTVLVPWILNHHDRVRLLTPIFDRRSVNYVGAEGDLQKYQYRSGQYDDNAEFWLDTQNVLVRYCWNEWDVQLEKL